MRSISVSPCGDYLASGDEEGNVIVWQVATTRILRRYKLENKVIDCLEWAPVRGVLAVCNEDLIYVFQPALAPRSINAATASLIDEAEKTYAQEQAAAGGERKDQWSFA